MSGRPQRTKAKKTSYAYDEEVEGEEYIPNFSEKRNAESSSSDDEEQEQPKRKKRNVEKKPLFDESIVVPPPSATGAISREAINMFSMNELKQLVTTRGLDPAVCQYRVNKSLKREALVDHYYQSFLPISEERYQFVLNLYKIGKTNKIGIFQQPEVIWGLFRPYLRSLKHSRTDNDFKEAISDWLENRRTAEVKYGHISQWDTSRVTNVADIFNSSPWSDKKNRSTKRGFNDDISGWDMSAVTNARYMFYGCRYFNKDISKWKVSKLVKMRGMFVECKSFRADLSSWNVPDTADVRDIFRKASMTQERCFNHPNLKNIQSAVSGINDYSGSGASSKRSRFSMFC
jgi:hypothetical protein